MLRCREAVRAVRAEHPCCPVRRDVATPGTTDLHHASHRTEGNRRTRKHPRRRGGHSTSRRRRSSREVESVGLEPTRLLDDGRKISPDGSAVHSRFGRGRNRRRGGAWRGRRTRRQGSRDLPSARMGRRRTCAGKELPRPGHAGPGNPGGVHLCSCDESPREAGAPELGASRVDTAGRAYILASRRHAGGGAGRPEDAGHGRRRGRRHHGHSVGRSPGRRCVCQQWQHREDRGDEIDRGSGRRELPRRGLLSSTQGERGRFRRHHR